MNARFLTLLLCLAVTPSGRSLLAQKAATEAVTDKAPAAAESDSHTKAVEEFLTVMDMETTTKKTIDQMLMMQVQQQPQMAVFSDVMKEFLQKHLSFDAVKGEMIALYKKEFTEQEIGELTEFYQTPIGKKAVQKLPSLAAAGAQIGARRVQANMGELQAAIAKRQGELQAESAE